jgi:hypothetical protein
VVVVEVEYVIFILNDREQKQLKKIPVRNVKENRY